MSFGYQVIDHYRKKEKEEKCQIIKAHVFSYLVKSLKVTMFCFIIVQFLNMKKLKDFGGSMK